MVRLDRAAAEPLHHQLYRQIRDELRSGNFSRSSSRLPSSRALAADLGISRFTVNLAFSELQAEGYLIAKTGSGTFVADPLPDAFLSADQRKLSPQMAQETRFSDRVNQIPDRRMGQQFDLGPTEAAPGVLLQSGIPAVDEFPIAIWERLRAQVLAKKGVNLLRYGSNRGDADLRKAVAAYLCDFRGAHCHPDQILIVAGMQQAMLISAMAVLDPGDCAWIEDPGFHQARRVFAVAGATIVPRPVDAEGIVIHGAPSRIPPRIIYVTPSHQFPLGVMMSLKRREALLEFAQARGAYILEDDYNAEFRFSGPPLPCLQGLDRTGRVIYAGIMSKILYPSLRLGYLLVPAPLADAVAKLRTAIDQHSPTIDQATLARFISEGFYLSHVRRMRKIYSERREVFIEQFNKLLGDRFNLEIADAGLHALAWFRSEKDLPLLQRAGPKLGVKISSLSFFCIDAKLPPALLLGFAAWSPAQIREGLVRLARALEKQPVADECRSVFRNGNPAR
ncbi:MAG: GntR family transcriptional regulator / MocR family aminotransferase [Verrucomicrobiota bacterium]|jgi:GntR family transcriptional regulator/MocR family aminotransferase